MLDVKEIEDDYHRFAGKVEAMRCLAKVESPTREEIAVKSRAESDIAMLASNCAWHIPELLAELKRLTVCERALVDNCGIGKG